MGFNVVLKDVEGKIIHLSEEFQTQAEAFFHKDHILQSIPATFADIVDASALAISVAPEVAKVLPEYAGEITSITDAIKPIVAEAEVIEPEIKSIESPNQETK